jgi:hypothetical protein
MEKARLETFVGWPHVSRNHGANKKKACGDYHSLPGTC